MRISIITINRNNAEGLASTIESVVRQTSVPHEFIVIDGGSTDGSADVIRRSEKNITRWVSEPDAGIYQAMNKGIGMTSGTHLLFLNSGDRLFSNSLLADILAAGFTEEVIFGDIMYDGHREPIVMPDEIDIRLFLGQSIGHGATLMKKTLFTQFGLYDESNRIVSDWAFFLKVLITEGCSYRHVPRIFTIYQSGGISVDESYARLQQEERDKTLRLLFPHFYEFIRESLKTKEELDRYHQSGPFRWLERLRSSRLNYYRRQLFLPRKK